MKYPILFAAICLSCFPACKKQGDPSRVLEQIQLVKEKYAPDPRVAFFNLSAEAQDKGWVVKGMTISQTAHDELFGRLQKEGIRVIDSVEVLPSIGLKGKLYGVVNVSVCNIRSGPKHSAELATQALLGTVLRVWKKDGGFYLVQTPDDYFGWVDSGGFVLMGEEEYQSYLKADRVVCLEDYVFAFAEPDEASGRVSDLLAGNILQVTGQHGNFTQIAFPDGRTGYVISRFLLLLDQWLESRQPDASHILATAKAMMGRPYLWGGTSGKGMDCSGFTKMAFYLNGLQLPRDASQQVHVGEPVETDTTLKNLLAGDLLFFGKKATETQKERISHVAIYLGDGKIIHASNMVETASLKRGDPEFQEDRLNSFVRSKRMIGVPPSTGVVPLSQVPYYFIGKMPD